MRNRMYIICVLFIAFTSSQLLASEIDRNEWGVGLGYAFLTDTHDSYSVEGFLRHYFKQNVGIELSGMYIPGRTERGEAVFGDIDPPIVIREEVTSYSVPLRFGVTYSPQRESDFGTSLVAGAGILFGHTSQKLLDEPPPEFANLFPEHSFTEGILELYFGVSGEYAFGEKFLLIPKATVSYAGEGGFGLVVMSLGAGYRF
jgi:hypothetical protein